MLKQRRFFVFVAAVVALLAAFVLAALLSQDQSESDNFNAEKTSSAEGPALQMGPVVETVLTGLDNPRGVVVLADGSLMVAEAGIGLKSDDPQELTGRLTHFQDTNKDGDYSDEGERVVWLDNLPTYNALSEYSTWRDEVSGPGDLLRHTDGHLYLTVDGGHGKIGVYEVSPYKQMGRNLSARGNMNGLAFSRDHTDIYIAESTANALSVVNIDDGTHRTITQFGALASGQQSVPTGVAVDPRNDDLLVALFTGSLVVDGETIAFVPGDSVIVRVDPENGAIEDAVLGLTTAIDVAVDGDGNIYVVEMTSGPADPIEPTHDLFDPDQAPLHGGYLRFTGRVTRYAPDGSAEYLLAEGLDMPTNITLVSPNEIYISTGQGTPNRPIPGPEGPTTIVGEVVRITLPDEN